MGNGTMGFLVKGERSAPMVGTVYEVIVEGEGSPSAPSAPWAVAFHVTSGMIKQGAFSDALKEFGLSSGEIAKINSRVQTKGGFTGTYLVDGQEFGFDHTDGTATAIVKKLGGGFSPSSGSYSVKPMVGVEAQLHADVKRVLAMYH